MEPWNIKEKVKTSEVKMSVNTMDFHSPLQFFKLCLTVEAKLAKTLSDVV